MDEKIASFYKQENILYNLYACFAAIAIFLSCLGLYGLSLLYGGTTFKGSWYTKSAWCKHTKYCVFVFQGIHRVNRRCLCDWHAPSHGTLCMTGYSNMLTEHP